MCLHLQVDHHEIVKILYLTIIHRATITNNYKYSEVRQVYTNRRNRNGNAPQAVYVMKMETVTRYLRETVDVTNAETKSQR